MPIRTDNSSNERCPRGVEGHAASERSVLAYLIALTAVAALIATLTAAANAFPAFVEQWSVPGHPQEVEVDPLGRLWISCFDDSVRVYAPSGGQLLFAFGGNGAGDGQFNNPYGIAFDAVGDAYICDYLGVRVEKFDASGHFLFSWPTPGFRADHVAIDAAGDVYVSGFSDQSVHKFTSAGVPILDWLSNGTTFPSGIVEAGGVMHVVQWNGPTVERYMPDGTFLDAFETGALNATDIETDAAGRLWVADYEHGQIRLFASDGTLSDSTGAVGTGPGEFQGLSGLAIGLDGSIYATDEQNSRVQRFRESTTDVAPDAPRGRPGRSAIRSIAPNPCRVSMTLAYGLAAEEHVRLTVHDVSGRLVGELENGRVSAGAHQTTWSPRAADGTALPAGVYLMRLEHEGSVDVGRVVIVR